MLAGEICILNSESGGFPCLFSFFIFGIHKTKYVCHLLIDLS